MKSIAAVEASADIIATASRPPIYPATTGIDADRPHREVTAGIRSVIAYGESAE